ncbi:MAG TPA: hypothetical protein VKU40_11645 [Thermoanaerobaculia bacterium]|nr:hypothetical protein [Thermoanaerobaculia bacterium]
MRKTLAALLAVAALAVFALPATALPSCSCSYCATHEFDQCWSFEQGKTTFCFPYLETYCGWEPFTLDVVNDDEPWLTVDCGEALQQPLAEPANEGLERFLVELAVG